MPSLLADALTNERQEWPPRPYERDEDNDRYARAVETCEICRPGRMCSLHYGQLVGRG